MADAIFPNQQEMNALAQWRQGDFSLDIQFFIYVHSDGSEDPDVEADDNVVGVVVVSQTCDIVRYANSDRHITVCPLVKLDPKYLPDIVKGSSTRFVALETADPLEMCIDLNRMMSISKDQLIKLNRLEGFKSEQTRQEFAWSLERKLGRFAFPNDFASLQRAIRDMAKKKHAKSSEAGKAFRAIKYIRARATPNWEAKEVSVEFYVIYDKEAAEINRKDTEKILESEFGGLKYEGRYKAAKKLVQVRDLENYTARDWLESQHLDLDFISS